MSTGEVKVPGPDHPITIEPHEGRVVVRVGDHVIADTDDALELLEASYPPVLYVPLDDVDGEVLTPSETTSWCPYKGSASYFTVQTDDATLDDVVWTYEHPHDAVAEIRGRVAFYPDRVTVEG